jgi:hypothetical protein
VAVSLFSLAHQEAPHGRAGLGRRRRGVGVGGWGTHGVDLQRAREHGDARARGGVGEVVVLMRRVVDRVAAPARRAPFKGAQLGARRRETSSSSTVPECYAATTAGAQTRRWAARSG